METRKQHAGNLAIHTLRRQARNMMREMRSLRSSMNQNLKDSHKKAYRQFNALLEREEFAEPHPSTTLLEQRARLEKRIERRNEEEAIRQTEYEEKEEDLKDKLYQQHHKIQESEAQKQNALLGRVVDQADLELQIRAKRAEIDVEIQSDTSCWSSFFCCYTSPVLKQKQKELDLMLAQLDESKASADSSKTDQVIAQQKNKRKDVIHDLDALADTRVTDYDSDSDRDEERLADVNYQIERDLDNQTHQLPLDAMVACLRFYLASCHLFEHFPSVETISADVNALKKQANQIDVKYLKHEDSILTQSLKGYFYGDEDGMTTTFTEFYRRYLQQAKNMSDKERLAFIKSDDFGVRLLNHLPEQELEPSVSLTI